MKNNIEKLILSIDDENIVAFAIVGENLFEVYYVTEDNVEELQAKMDEIYEKLIEAYVPNANSLTEEEQVDELIKKGIVYKVDKPLIKKITYNADEIVVERGDEIETIKRDSEDLENKYEELLNEIEMVYGLDAYDAMEFGLLEIKKFTTNKKLANKIKFNKRVIAAFVAGALAVGGINFVLNKVNNKKVNNSKNTVTLESADPTATPEAFPTEEVSTITLDAAQTATPAPATITEPTVTPTAVLTATPLSANWVEQPSITFTSREIDPESLTLVEEIIDNRDGSELYTTVYNVDSEFYDCSKDNLCQVSFNNMSEIGSKLQSPDKNSFQQRGTMINFEKLFENQYDKAYIEYFSRIRNEAIYQAYYEKDLNSANHYIALGNYEVARCLRDNNPVVVNIDGQEQYITFDELSADAKEVVFNLAYSLQIAMANNEIEYNGEILNQDDFHNILDNVNNTLTNSK